MTHPPAYTLPSISGSEGRILLKVRAAPGSRRDQVTGVHGDALRVAVRAPAERGKANAALVEVLARELGLRRSEVALHSGGASRDKWIRIDALSREELLRRLRGLLAEGRGRDGRGGGGSP